MSQYFGNLQPVPPQGTSFLMPTGIPGLSIPPQGRSVGNLTGGDYGGLKSRNMGAGANGGPSHGPELTVLSDEQDYVSYHVSQLPRVDGSHRTVIGKHDLGFILADPTPDNRNKQGHTVVSLAFINRYLKDNYERGFEELENFAKSFVEQHKEFFPALYTGSQPTQPQSHTISLGLSSLGGSVVLGAPVSSTLAGSAAPTKTLQQIKLEDIMTEFVMFMQETLPTEDFLFNVDMDISWITPPTHSSPSSQKGTPRSLIGVLAQAQREDSKIGNQTRSDIQNNPRKPRNLDPAYSDRVDKYKRQLDYYGKVASSSGRKYDAQIVLDKPLPDSLYAYIGARLENKQKAVTEIVNFFKNSIDKPNHLFFTPPKNVIGPSRAQFLLRGGFMKNWRFAGVVNTFSETSRNYNSFGIHSQDFNMVKLVPYGRQECRNIWGGRIPLTTPLYLVLQRRPKTADGSSMLSNLQTYFRESTKAGRVGNKSSIADNKSSTARKNAQAAWRDYGEYEIIPQFLPLTRLTRQSYPYIDILGREAHGKIFQAGVAIADEQHPGDVNVPHYNDTMQSMAIGRQCGSIELCAESSKKAALTLPNVLLIVTA